MERLRYIRSAVVDHDLSRFPDLRDGKELILSDPGDIVCKESIRDIQIEKARPHNFRGKNITGVLRSMFQDILRDQERRLMILLRGSQRPVALEFAQVRTV